MIGAILASLGTFRSAFRLRIALIASLPLVDGLPWPPDRSSPAGGARRRCRRSFGGGAGSGMPRIGASSSRALPDLLGHERHDRMEQPAEPVQDRGQHPLGGRAGRRIAEPALDELEVPVAEVAPGEVAEPPGRLGELEVLQVGGHSRRSSRSSPSRIQRSSIGRASRSSGPGS